VNFMGMGMPEIAVIMLVAFLVLGPSRSITMARTAGKLMRDLRRTFSEVTAVVNMDPREQPRSRPEAAPLDRGEEPPPKAALLDQGEEPPPKAAPLDQGEELPPKALPPDRGEEPPPKAGDE
jgi:sec-independent protein translocase protein TatA